MLLVLKLIKDGEKYPEALRIAWEWILIQSKPNFPFGSKPPIVWAPLLGRSWWLMLIIFGVTWVNSSEIVLFPVVLFLILLHIYWFLEGHLYRSERFERILNLNQNWGIIYKEIGEDSGMESKTLAELDLRKKNLLVLAIDRGGQLTPFPKGLEVLAPGDRLVMFGDLYSYHGIFESDAAVKPAISENN